MSRIAGASFSIGFADIATDFLTAGAQEECHWRLKVKRLVAEGGEHKCCRRRRRLPRIG